VNDVLFVCTGNRCRSPVAEALAWQALRVRGIQATTASAGLLEGGAPLPEETVHVLARYAVDGRKRLSAQVTRELVAESTLVVGMERSHVREIALLDPTAWHRTFTLRELVRRASAAGPRQDGESMLDWAERIAADRDPADMLGSSEADDIVDPIGAPYAEHERTAMIILELVDRLVDLAWPGDRP
jgi:protein-tyrosine phosphatase